MRIMMVNPFYYPNEIGGTERVVHQLCEEMVKRGHSVAVLSLDGQLKNRLPEIINGVSVYRCTEVFTLREIGGYCNVRLTNTSFNEEIKNVIEKFKPDVAHTHNIYGFSPTIWKQIKKYNIPIVHTLHDYWLLGEIQKTVAAAYVKYIDYLTVPSQFVLNKVTSTGLFHNISTECIPNGIYYDKEVAYAVNDKALKRINQDNKITFIYAGQLEEIKGIKQLIEAFKLLDKKDVKLLICGDGRLKDYVENNQQQNIKYLGKLRYDELEKVYMNGTILCAPSVWEEPFGMVALEAYYF